MRVLLTLILFFSTLTFAQAPVEKCTDQLKQQMLNSAQNSEILVWIIFKDKGPDSDAYFSFPQNVVSEKSLQRRAKVFDSNSLLEQTDLPVYSNYIEQVKSLGFRLKQKSKWFNAVSGYIPISALNSISVLPFVNQIDLVAQPS